jgi:chromosome segregation ATPase
MLSVIKFDPQYDGVMRQLFAETVIVSNLDAGGRVSRNERFNCVTIDGDQVNRRGPLTGGYMDRKRSKLEASNFLCKTKEKLAPAEVRILELFNLHYILGCPYRTNCRKHPSQARVRALDVGDQST